MRERWVAIYGRSWMKEKDLTVNTQPKREREVERKREVF